MIMGRLWEYIPYIVAAIAFSPFIWNYAVRPYILNGNFYNYWKPLAYIGACAVGLLLYLRVKNKALKTLLSTVLILSFLFYPWIFGWKAPFATAIVIFEFAFWPVILYFLWKSSSDKPDEKSSPPIDEQINYLESQIKKLLAKENLSEEERLRLIDLQVKLSKLYEKKGFRKGYNEGFASGYVVGDD
jgi:hypothetical protein